MAGAGRRAVCPVCELGRCACGPKVAAEAATAFLCPPICSPTRPSARPPACLPARPPAPPLPLSPLQALRYEASDDSRLAGFLVARARRSTTLASFLYWYLLTELEDDAFMPRAACIHVRRPDCRGGG